MANNKNFNLGIKPNGKQGFFRPGLSNKWYICSKKNSKALQLLLKTVLPHVYLESELFTSDFGAKTFEDVLADYWAGLSEGRCPNIQDIPGFVETREFPEGFGLRVPDTKSFNYRHEMQGVGRNVSGVETVTGTMQTNPGKKGFFIYDNTTIVPPLWGNKVGDKNIHSRLFAPAPDYCIPPDSVPKYGSAPGIYDDNGSGWNSIGWKGAPNERVYGAMFANEGYSSNMESGATFGEKTQFCNLHATTLYSYNFSTKSHKNLKEQSNRLGLITGTGTVYDGTPQPLSRNQAKNLFTFSQAFFKKGDGDFKNINSGIVSATINNPSFSGGAYYNYCDNEHIMDFNSLDGKTLVHHGRDILKTQYLTFDETLHIIGFVNGVFEVIVPNSWVQGISRKSSILDTDINFIEKTLRKTVPDFSCGYPLSESKVKKSSWPTAHLEGVSKTFSGVEQGLPSYLGDKNIARINNKKFIGWYDSHEEALEACGDCRFSFNNVYHGKKSRYLNI